MFDEAQHRWVGVGHEIRFHVLQIEQDEALVRLNIVHSTFHGFQGNEEGARGGHAIAEVGHAEADRNPVVNADVHLAVGADVFEDRAHFLANARALEKVVERGELVGIALKIENVFLRLLLATELSISTKGDSKKAIIEGEILKTLKFYSKL